ncbi:hypothetical protein LTEGF4_25690 (plasmid) [Limnohabitans sp. TEGF004]|nr:hypothetical protein LTEGF4_25690 [Limnohabitans sp. TEGF004]
MAIPYDIAAANPAAIAIVPFSCKVSASTPASTPTPMSPKVIPKVALMVSGDLNQSALMTAAQMGAVALRMDRSDALTVLAA